MEKSNIFLAIFMIFNLVVMPIVNAANESFFDEEIVEEPVEVEEVLSEANLENDFSEEEEDNETGNYVLVDIEEIIDEDFNTSLGEEENESSERLEGNESLEEELNESVEEVTEEELNETEEYVLVDIEEVVEEENFEEENVIVSNDHSSISKENNVKEVKEEIEEVEMVTQRLVKNGQVEVEFEVEEGDDIIIEKKEFDRGDLEKTVKIFSEEHFEDELRVYSDLPSPAKKRDIKIVWENEDLVVTETAEVEYYDEDSDGLIERISWVVPHLSSQYYNIIIDVDESGSESDEIILSVNGPLEGATVSNPVEFEVGVNYSEPLEVQCYLKINGQPVEFSPVGVGQNESISKNLAPGNYNWEVFCEDNDDGLAIISNDSSSGTFNIQASNLSVGEVKDFYFNGTEITGTITSPGGNVFAKLIGPSGSNDIVISEGSFTIASNLMTVPGDYILNVTTDYYAENFSIQKEIAIGYASVIFKETEVDVDEAVNVEWNLINVPSSGSFLIEAGGELVHHGQLSQISGMKQFTPDEEKDYGLVLKIYLGAESYTVAGNTLSAENGEDKEKPDITLVSPVDYEVVKEDKVIFEYMASDNIKLKNCSLILYNASDGISDQEIFPISSADKNLAKVENPEDDKRIKVELVDFDEGEYFWEVGCYDNNSNYAEDLIYFYVNYSDGTVKTSSQKEEELDYDRKEEVDDMIDSINDFLEKESNYGPGEMEVLKVLGISKEVVHYKDKLLQHDRDLKEGFKAMDEAKRQKRIGEIYDEIDEIKKDIPTAISILNTYDYGKASLDTDLGEIIEGYMEATSTEIKKGALKSLVKANEELQKDLTVDVSLRKVKVDYAGRSDTLVLVMKTIDLSDASTRDFLEFLPDGLRERDIEFLVDVEEVGNGIWKFVQEDLSEGKLIYYFEEEISFDDVETSETILFAEDVKVEGFGITGFSISVGDGLGQWTLYILMFTIILCYVGMVIFGKVKLESWKRKEPNVARMLDLIKQTKTLVFENEIETAHEKYHQMKEIYKVLPVKTRKFFYKEIRRVHLMINKKDILNLVREYDKARKEYRKDDAALLYNKINSVYKKLPKKYQDKVYQKVVRSSL